MNLGNLLKPLLVSYLKGQLADLEVELALRWARGIPSSPKKAAEDVIAAIRYVLTHGSRRSTVQADVL